jgi:hypothetical protein
MLLVEGWQDLHEQEQQEIKSLTLDYIHLQQEHRVSAASMPCLQDSLLSGRHASRGSRHIASTSLVTSVAAPDSFKVLCLQ